MSTIQHSVPIVGNWYNSRDLQESFMIINCDQNDGIEIQYKDGELDAMDFDEWDAFNPHEIAEPEDEIAPYGPGINQDHDDEMIRLLGEIESQEDLEQHLRQIDSEESDW